MVLELCKTWEEISARGTGDRFLLGVTAQVLLDFIPRLHRHFAPCTSANKTAWLLLLHYNEVCTSRFWNNIHVYRNLTQHERVHRFTCTSEISSFAAMVHGLYLSRNTLCTGAATCKLERLRETTLKYSITLQSSAQQRVRSTAISIPSHLHLQPPGTFLPSGNS